MNQGNIDLTNQVLKTVEILMESDDGICIKFVKLKLLSNILNHFIIEENKINKKQENLLEK